MKFFLAMALLLLPVFVQAQQWSTKPLASEDYYERKLLIKRSLELKVILGSVASDEQVTRITGLIYDTWRENRSQLIYIRHPRFALALAWSESELQHEVSGTCLGIFQADIDTSREVCRKYGIPYTEETLPSRLLNDESFSVLVGLCELNEQVKFWRGNKDLGIISYKCGPYRVQGWLEKGRIPMPMYGLESKVYKYNEFLAEREYVHRPVNISYGPYTLIRMFPGKYELAP